VTGNFVTLGSALANGTSGAVAKLIALPVFCLAVMASRIYSTHHTQSPVRATSHLLAAKFLLLLVSAILAISWGPFVNGDSSSALVTGMTLVLAMGIQNAIHRMHMSSSPPTTLMTGSTTQTVLDIADLLFPRPESDRQALLQRIRLLAPTILAFAIGCLAAAALFRLVGLWLFTVPPLMSLFAWHVHSRSYGSSAGS
jgi:uncharacterized membrane protein YoaK (UPF0700 family)